MEAFSDNTVRVGQFGRKSLFVSPSGVGIGKETPLNAILDVSGSAIVTGSISATLGFTGSLAGSASYAATSSHATSFKVENSLVVSGSVTATSAIARSTYINPTLVASANSDTLVGLDINPTFNTGSFTGVTNYALRAGFSHFTNLIHFTGPTAGNSTYFGNDRIDAYGNNSFSISSNGTGTFSFASSAGTIVFATGGSSKARLFASTGNFTLQNGGTFTDAGYRLDAFGLTRFTGTTASDTAPLGSELAGVTGTGTNWALAGGATNLNVGGYVHTVGSVDPLTTSLAAVIGTYYQVAWTVTGRTAGSFNINIGGYTIGNLSSNGNMGPVASSTAALSLTPTTDFDGTVVLSVKTIGTSSASSTFANSGGTSNIEIRANSVVTNTFIGLNAGRRNTTGIQNTFFGNNAGIQNTTGASNSFFGLNTGTNNSIGANNAFFGAFAGATNTTGGNNTFVGTSAGAVNTTGNSNTFIGQAAGTNNTTAINNTFTGTNSGQFNTTGNQHTFIGTAAGQSNTTGVENTFIGTAAGVNNTTGSNNVCLGRSAGRFISDGTTSNTITDNSIYIGHTTKALANNQTNQIVIGYNSTGLGSNTTVLGNSSTVTTAIYGNLLLGTTSTTGANLTTAASITAASAIARGVYFNNTLVASANSDVLIGLDIAPTFTNGAFTGVKNYWLQMVGNSNINGTNQIILSRGGVGVFTATTLATTISTDGPTIPLRLSLNATSQIIGQFHGTTGNLTLQNGGTFTDAGYRLDVVGTARVQGTLTVVSASIQSQNTSSLASGTQTISTNATGSFTAAFYNYTVASGSNTRAGQFIATWNGSSLQYMDNSTLDIGNTSAVALTGSLSGANVLLTSTLPSNGWTIKTLVDLI
jgi:hypothetical protein